MGHAKFNPSDSDSEDGEEEDESEKENVRPGEAVAI